VYRVFSGPPNYWSRAQIRANVIERYAVGQTQLSAFDPASIMTYPIDAALTLDGTHAAPPVRLSATDVAFIRQQYPR
jgi:serralysin